MKAKLNKRFVRLSSILLAVVLTLVPVSFTASAVDLDFVEAPLTMTEYNLPFPHPSTFGNYYGACVFQSTDRTSGALLTEMDVLTFTPLNADSDGSAFDTLFSFYLDSNEIAMSMLATIPKGVAGTIYYYRLRYNQGSSSYTIICVSAKSCSGTDVGTLTVTPSLYDGSSDSRVINIKSVATFGPPAMVSSSVPNYTQRNINYTFHGEISTSFLEMLIDNVLITVGNELNSVNNNLDSANDKLDSANDKLDSANSKLDSANSKLDSANNKLDSANNKLESIKSNTNSIKLYTKDILDILQEEYEGFNSLTTEKQTTNADVSNYQKEEESLMNDNFSAVNGVMTNATEASYFNKGSRANAMKFLSAQIEFFSGNDVTADYSRAPNAMKKISAAINLILGLGLASFAIGLVNRRKS